MVLKRTINVFIKTTLENTFVEHSVRMAEMYGVYTHLIYEQNPGIYGQKAMFSLILSACNSILARYFDEFL